MERRAVLPARLPVGRLSGLQRAAVLVALVGDQGVLLIRRADHLRAHAGQVAFPGGRIDPGEDAPAAALREAWEEVGLDPAQVRLVGRLPDTVTGTGYRVSPIVARIPAGLPLVPAPAEVAAVFVLPLAVLLDPHAPERRARDGRSGWWWPHADQAIWGATAAMLVDLAAWLRGQPSC